MNDEYQKQLDAQEGQQMRVQSASEAMRAAAEQKQRTVHNEDFLNELRKADLGDSEVWDWLEDEYPTWFSGAHVVANRHEEYGLEAELKMRNKRERALTENRPGRLLRDRPFLLASMQNAESPQLDAYDDPRIPGDKGAWADRIIHKDQSRQPVTSEEQSRIYGGADVAAALMTMGQDARGLESVSTVKTETTTRKQETEEGTASRIGGLMK